MAEEKKVNLFEAIIVVLSEISKDPTLGDDEAIDMILGEIRSCLTANKIKLPKTALQSLTFNSQYHYER